MSKWSSIDRFPLPVIIIISVIPALTASSTRYCITGLSTIGSISFGWAFVAGKKRVQKPAAGIMHLVIFFIFYRVGTAGAFVGSFGLFLRDALHISPIDSLERVSQSFSEAFSSDIMTLKIH